MRTIKFTIAAIAVILWCSDAYSQNNKLLTSFRSKDGKELLVSRKYVYLKDKNTAQEQVLDYEVNDENRNQLWLSQLDGGYEAGEIMLNADGTITVEIYNPESKDVYQSDASILNKLTTRLKQIEDIENKNYWDRRESYKKLIQNNAWLMGCWLCSEQRAYYVITEDTILYYKDGLNQSKPWIDVEIMNPKYYIEEDGTISIYPDYKFGDTSSQSENGLVVNLQTHEVNSEFFEDKLNKAAFFPY